MVPLSKIIRFYYTIKHLKPIQFIYRLKLKFLNVKFRTEDISLREIQIPFHTEPLLPSLYKSDGDFQFLNELGSYSDWKNKKKPKLWLYNLHYFDDLVRENYIERQSVHRLIIKDWIANNEFMSGDGWEPYPLSLRIVNWIKYLFILPENNQYMRSSLIPQVFSLEKQLEYHLLGNHLFANAKALIFAGCYFKGNTANAWLEKGLRILDREVSEQILRDGGNFELSPMYHNIILADMLDLYNLGLTYNIDSLKSKLGNWHELILKMLEWSFFMSHPDGEVSFFNDSAFSVAPPFVKLDSYAKSLGIINKSELIYNPNTLLVKELKNTGYTVAFSKQVNLIIDLAPIGPDYIPGHGHADALSFELSIFGQRFIVNSGTSQYSEGPQRSYERESSAHNTVTVNGLSSSNVWGAFRVAQRANVNNIKLNKDTSKVSISAEHDGFKQQGLNVLHFREFDVTHDSIKVHDKLTGSYDLAYVYYHFHPELVLLQTTDKSLTFKLANGKVVQFVSDSIVDIIPSCWSPEFGIHLPNTKVRIKIQNGVSTIKIFFGKIKNHE